jgi:hypothetical protein
MDKRMKITIALAFIIGLVFVVAGLTLYGIINDRASLGDGLSNPAYWIYGVIFGAVLALGAWKTKSDR